MLFLNLVSVWGEKQHYDSLKSSCGAPLQKQKTSCFWCTISIISDQYVKTFPFLLHPAHLLLQYLPTEQTLLLSHTLLLIDAIIALFL